MTDPMVIAAAAVVIIGAMSTATVAVIAALGRMKRDLIAGQLKVETKADEIHTLVNGGATLAAQKLAALEGQIVALNMALATTQQQRVDDVKESRRSRASDTP